MEKSMRRKRLLLSAAAAVVVITLAALYLLGAVLVALGISAVIAYALLPVAQLLERGMPWRNRRPALSRGIATGIIFLAGLGILIGLGILVVPNAIQQGQRLIEGFPSFFNSARITVEGWVALYAELAPKELRDRADEILADTGDIMVEAAWGVVSKTMGAVSNSFAFVLGLATAPVLIFYLMKDSAVIKSSLYTPFPLAIRPYLRDVLGIVERTLGGYIRGQLILGLVVGGLVTVGLLLLGVPFALILGIVAGLTELIPIVGPWIGGAAGVLVALATAPDKILWVVLLYLVVQLLENTLLAPRIQGFTLKLHPVAIILVVIVGSHFFGLWGIILGPPLAALGKDTIAYFVHEWNRPEVLTDTETAVEGDVEKPESAVGEPTEVKPPNTQSHSS